MVIGGVSMSGGKGTVVGALIWVCGLTTVGYLFGNLPFVQQHLSKSGTPTLADLAATISAMAANTRHL